MNSFDEHPPAPALEGNAVVYLDVSVNDGPACRMEFVLYHTVSPLAAENFRQMCTGEKSDGVHTFVGASFYRVLAGTSIHAGVFVQLKDQII